MVNIGENIKKYRKLRGLTQSELAGLIGKHESMIRKYESNFSAPSLSRSNINRYENDYVSPKISTLELIAEVLEVSIPELLGYPPQEIIYKEKPLSEVSTEDLLNELERRTRCEYRREY